MYRIIFAIIFILFARLSEGSVSLKIGILTGNKITSAWLSPACGSYLVYGDGQRIMEVSVKQWIHVSVKGDSILIKSVENISSYKKIKIVGKEAPNSFNLKPLQPALTERTYTDNLEVSAENHGLSFVNNVNLDHYVAGVVEAENGIKQNFEYYKATSIICRTYALSNLRRHEDSKFQLCDKVHCQVYYGQSKGNDDIVMASLATVGMVLVDSDLKLITAAFHSNCGGQTLNSEDVWALPTSYLKSIKDTFCLNQAHAKWEYRIGKEDWISYLQKSHKYSLPDSIHRDCIFNYSQKERETEYVSHNLKIPLKTMRSQLNLKSTYFSFEPENETILLKGKGYGHGLGLCQEGAMRMAKLGYKHKEILHHYYKDVHLVDLSALDFFRN